MTLEQLINAIFPLLFGVGGLYLFLHTRITIRKRNKEIELTWKGKQE
jgi:hypothetical protein